jgi:hypothetical protein
MFAAPRASSILPRTRNTSSFEGLAEKNILKILKNKSQRRLLSRFPFPRHFLGTNTLSPPEGPTKFPCIRKGFEIRVAGAVTEYSAKMRSPGPILSKAGDLSDFPARCK